MTPLRPYPGRGWPFPSYSDAIVFCFLITLAHTKELLSTVGRQENTPVRSIDLNGLGLPLALGHLLDLQVCFLWLINSLSCARENGKKEQMKLGLHTGRKRLLELLCLLGILQGEGVQVLGASDLELNQGALLVLLDPGGCDRLESVRS